MLKKNPTCVETIKRIRRYIGNTKNWKLTDSEKDTFNDRAEVVREIAEEIYTTFKVVCFYFQLFFYCQNYLF